MGIKLSEAYYSPENRFLQISEAEELGAEILKGNLFCSSEVCRTPLRFVNRYNKGKESEITVPSYFGLKSGGDSYHSDDCQYNVEGQIRIIAREADDMIQSLKDGKYKFRLHLLSEALGSKQGGLKNSSTGKGIGTYGNVGTTYTAKGKLLAYLSTARKIVELRSKVDAERGIAQYIKIQFRNNTVRWADFYFERENLPRLFARIKQDRHPVCIEGEVKSIQLPLAGRKYTTLQLKSISVDPSDDGNKYIPMVKILLNEDCRVDGLKEGCKIVVFGTMKPPEVVLDRKRDKVIWMNAYIRVDHSKQLYVIPD